MHVHVSKPRTTVAAIVTAVLISGCGGGGGGGIDVDVLPAFLSALKRIAYDGTSDDLLTAGLGKTGLASATAPAAANPAAPTTAELRKIAIYNNYRAIVDVVARGGYGVLYGPNIDRNDGDTLGEGRIAGVEYLAYADDGSGLKNVTLMVQIPSNWDRNRPCNGNLQGKPAILVHGRSDTLVPPTFTSRPYFGLNKIVEGTSSKLSYIEVTNAQYFDAFIDNAALPGYDSMFVPLHYYFIQALHRMYAHLTTGAPLPPSQVVHTTPRGGTPGQAPQITAANVAAISQSPAASNLITFSNNTVVIPE